MTWERRCGAANCSLMLQMDPLDPQLWLNNGLPAPEVISGKRLVSSKACFPALGYLEAAAKLLGGKVRNLDVPEHVQKRRSG